MSLSNLQDLYVDELKDLYNAEHQILKALPKMAKAATAPQLKDAFNHHLEETERQVERLEQIFHDLGKTPRGKKCIGMEGLIEEGKELLKEDAEPSVKDAGLISAAQRVEHYEMAAYGTVRTYAQILGYEEQARALQETLNEEGETDHKLTELAQGSINTKAQAEEGDAEQEDMEEDMGDESSMRRNQERSYSR
ncbi:MAG: ferritin-like domain-containing protein [Chloroflexi bacterium]|nr:ferritin-like domain-containing protein [Chloroflexota bacterium]